MAPPAGPRRRAPEEPRRTCGRARTCRRAMDLHTEHSVLRELRVHETTLQPSAVLARLSLAKNRAGDAEGFLANGSNGRDQLVGSVWQRYRDFLARTRALDFDDLLLETVRLLREHAEVRAHYRKLYRHILVDEYQDTNEPQYEIVKQIGGEPPQRVRGGRRRPVDLRLARGRHPEDPGLPPRFRGREDRPPADQLSLDAEILDAANAGHPQERLAPRQGRSSPRKARASTARFARLKDETAERSSWSRRCAAAPGSKRRSPRTSRSCAGRRSSSGPSRESCARTACPTWWSAGCPSSTARKCATSSPS